MVTKLTLEDGGLYNMSNQKFSMKVYLAFPGMGKTILATNKPRYIDLDFGIFREVMGVKKEDEGVLLPHFVKLMKYVATIYPKKVILTNEPKLLYHLPPGTKCMMYLPHPDVLKFSAAKLKVSEQQISEWIVGWREKARLNAVPVVYLKVGLNHYLG